MRNLVISALRLAGHTNMPPASATWPATPPVQADIGGTLWPPETPPDNERIIFAVGNREFNGGQLIIDDDVYGKKIISFVLVSATQTRELLIRTDTELVDDFREHLAAHGFRMPEGAARSVVSEIIIATAGNPAAWTAVGGIIVSFLRRHRGKVHRIEVEGNSVSIEGYSSKEAEALAEGFLAMSRERHTRGGSDRPTIGSRPDSV